MKFTLLISLIVMVFLVGCTAIQDAEIDRVNRLITTDEGFKPIEPNFPPIGACVDPASAECTDYCKRNSSSDTCRKTCQTVNGPRTPACDTFCKKNPNDSVCRKTCETDPTSVPCYSFCKTNPSSPTCESTCQRSPLGSACYEHCSNNNFSTKTCQDTCDVDPTSSTCLSNCIVNSELLICKKLFNEQSPTIR